MGSNFDIKKINVAQSAGRVQRSVHSSENGASKSTKPDITKMANLKKKSSVKSKLIKGFLILVVLLAVGGVGAYFMLVVPLKETYAAAQVAIQKARELKDAAKEQNLDLIRLKLDESDTAITAVKKEFNDIAWVKHIPFAGGYYRDGEHGLAASGEFIAAGKIALEAIAPHADLLGLSEGDSSFVNQPANKRIEMAVATLDTLIPELDNVIVHLKVAKQEIDQIDPSRYPAKINGKEVRAKIEAGQRQASEGIDMIVKIEPLIKLMPDLLGSTEVKRYLVLFQNDAELRSTGGFITAYAVFGVDRGSIGVEQSEDIYYLDSQQKKNLVAPPEVLKYHKGVNYAYIRDSNTSPDFYESMQTFEELLENVSNPPQYDGIIAVDTHVLVEGMKVLDGEVFVPEYGVTFTTQPDERCDGCPQVVYELEEFADRPTGHVRTERKDILGRLLQSFMKKALGVSPGQYWGRLMQTFITEANEKHILAYMKDEEAQKAMETLNYAGRITEFTGDYLHINDTNFGGAKSNMFVQETVTQDIEIGSDGTVIKTVTIDYANPSVYSNCNLESGELCLNGLLRNWIRVYVPQGSKLIEFNGASEEGYETETTEDFGKTVFGGFMTVRPEGSAHVTLKYQLPDKVGDTYTMLIQKQPGTVGHSYTTIINGKELETFDLRTDREFQYPI